MGRVAAYIGIGSNVGDRRDFCSRALGLLGLLPESALTAYSSTYETQPVGDVGGPFLNLVAEIQTGLEPRRLLAILQETEQGLGRDAERRAGPRTLDIDLLLYGDRVINEEGVLVVPHPRLHLRRFVLSPLAELEPTRRHPTLHHTMAELLSSLQDPHEVRRVDDPVVPWIRPAGRCGLAGM